MALGDVALRYGWPAAVGLWRKERMMCKCTPELRAPFCGKPGCQWPPQKLEVVTDAMAERLDEIADLGEVWKKNRARGHNPVITRGAMLAAARELVAMADAGGA